MRGGARTQHLPHAIQLHASTALTHPHGQHGRVHGGIEASRQAPGEPPAAPGGGGVSVRITSSACCCQPLGFSRPCGVQQAQRSCAGVVRIDGSGVVTWYHSPACMGGSRIQGGPHQSMCAPCGGHTTLKIAMHDCMLPMGRYPGPQGMAACNQSMDVDFKVTPGCIINLWLPVQGVSE